MKKLIIIGILLVTLQSIIAEDTENRIYIFKLRPAGNLEKDLDKKIRTMILISILKNYPKKYRVLDDDSIQNLSEKLRKLQMSGCSEDTCLREISNALDANEIISGEVSQEKGIITLVLKNLKKDPYTYVQSIKSSPPALSFPLSQTDYFVDEITKKLIEPAYEINYANAPPVLGEITEGDKGKGLLFLNSGDMDSINSILYNVCMDILKESEKERLRKNYPLSIQYLIYSYERLNSTLNPEERSNAKPFLSWILEKILSTMKENYKIELLSLDNSLNTGKLTDLENKYDFIINNIKNYRNEYQPLDLVSAIYYRISLIYTKRGDEYIQNLQFTASKTEFEKAIHVIDKVNVLHKKEYLTYINDLNKKNSQVNKLGKDYLENMLKSLCDSSGGLYLIYIANKSKNPEESELSFKKARIKMGEAFDIINKERNFIDEKIINYCKVESAKQVRK
jgi:hypothetical protein